MLPSRYNALVMGDLATDPVAFDPACGLYVHIPFCETKCGYCDFYSVALKDRDPTPLVDPVQPSAYGGLLYGALGFPIGSSPAFNVPTGAGLKPPVDLDIATSTARGGGQWLRRRFGLA